MWVVLCASLGAACYSGVDGRRVPAIDLADDDDSADGTRDPPRGETTSGGDEDENSSSSSGEDGFELTDLGLPQPTTRLVDGVELERIEITQGVYADIGRHGEAVPVDSIEDPALIRDRVALFRAHYVNAGRDGRPVEARLRLRTSEYESTLYSTPTELTAIGVVEWLVPGELVQPHLGYAVDFVVDVDTPIEEPMGAARTPADDYGELYVRSSPTALAVHVIPVRHQYGGCDQTPLPDEAWWQSVEDDLWMQYPIAELELERGDPWTYGGAMTDFSLVLADLSAHRVALAIPQHVYVYGLLLPCDGGEAGVGGRGWLAEADAMDGYYRTSLGRWYPDTPWFSTGHLVHEVGHNHGRQHVACNGEGDPDPNYPIPGGLTGREGWGIVDGVFRDAGHADFMTYCDPVWVSAYGWNLAFNRAAIVTANADVAPGPARSIIVAMEDGAGGLITQNISARMSSRKPTAELELVRDGGLVATVPAVVTHEAETGRRSYAAVMPDGLDSRSLRAVRRQ